jgi:hypothetical protein
MMARLHGMFLFSAKPLTPLVLLLCCCYDGKNAWQVA